ncbi:2',3'-cyclic-nucleotide 2'-phosphodiesterase (5'-nucleotidase family) [Anoxybacillus calidus]|uniref:2',3'-cyclic-nucleotide 2'-phosphodiesterase (5'-nucleotidase family) n=1 Tax=[Anoxybacillus] calidus TaxID=575178 RepID=A0A7V9YZS9_9BACL|nr:bifunctional UDP-sugar hydrolase/5'-nucleotidase [Anoxybacillus calidus]MBA2871472.1 2',3'-cyclic-nucleotide 2'-phosphodiesterase (5'-nucleotidase family) [Anoxybacillus calidus]
MKRTIYIYHTNDIHSHFENWPRIAWFLKKQRKVHQQRNETMLLFDIGDFVDRSHPITEATNGKANVELLNDLGYDAVTIGNNEGITLPYEHLNQLYQKADFPVLVANLFTRSGERPKWAQPYFIIPLSETLKIGVIGLTIHFTKFYELLGWTIENPFAVLKEILKELKPQVDFIILLSHLGIHEDEQIAEMFTDIDLILGAHTHHLLPEGQYIRNALLCGAGKYGEYIGVVKIEIDDETKTFDKKASIITVSELQECGDTEQKLASLYHQSEEKLGETIVELTEDLELHWFAPSRFPKLLAEALKEWCNGDIGMVNAGVLLEPLYKGIVTKKDLHRICPHPINPCKVYLRGDELKEVILQAATERMKTLQIKGLGFRGKIMGQMAYEGVQLETERLSDGLEHIEHIFINGEPLDLEKTYAVATIDMFTFGNLYPEIRRAERKEYYMPEFLRDVLAWKLSNLYKT